MGPRRRVFPEAFKREAVDRVTSSGHSTVQVAQELGLHETALRRRVRDLAHLRSRRVMRRGRMATTADQTRGQIIGAVSIRERPAEIEDRAVPGHWEGDLLSGARNSHIATLVERRSRFVMLVRVGGKDSESVVDALVR